MKHEYKLLMEDIPVPEALRERVLSAAREKRPAAARRPVLRRAVCALCALALVLGGVTLRTEEGGQLRGDDPVPEMDYTLGLTVYAAERGANGGVYLPEANDLDADALDGTIQTLHLTFADGGQESGTYRLEKEKLRSFSNEDGEAVLVPVLAGDEEEVTGLYAVPEDSVWFQWPVEGADTVSLSHPFGFPRWRPGGQTAAYHMGIDIPAEQGTPIVAAATGTVKTVDFDPDKGNYLILDHGDGMETVYAQCLSLSVEAGDAVEAGQEIAAVGSTGKSTGPHLCFQVWQDGEAQNPVAYFDSTIRDTLSMG